MQYNAGQNKTRQTNTIQCKMGQAKARQGNTIQYDKKNYIRHCKTIKSIQDNNNQYRTIQDNTVQGNTKQYNTI